MKRLAASLFGFSTVPLSILFVLTARPARLYAETAPPPPACEALQRTEPCAGREAGASCISDAGTGACFSALCRDTDAGFVTIDVLQCSLPVVTPVPSDDAGHDSGSDADAAADAAPDGSALEKSDASDGHVETEDATTDDGGNVSPGRNGGPDAGSPSTASNDDGGGCSASGGSSAGLAGTLLSVLLAAAMWRLRRRTRA